VADIIFKEWFCKFSIAGQIHTDRVKELVNKLSAQLFELLNVSHTKTSPAHPQYNAQVKVFNKKVKKIVDDSTLIWGHSYQCSPSATKQLPPLHLNCFLVKMQGSHHS
jgi:hypothetical protein